MIQDVLTPVVQDTHSCGLQSVVVYHCIDRAKEATVSAIVADRLWLWLV